MEKNIHWFPGHMKKALGEIQERLKVIDVIIELLDARCPLSSRNNNLFNMTKEKKRIVVFTKIDYADEKATKKWEIYFKNQGFAVILLDLTKNLNVKTIENMLELQCLAKREKEKKKGMKPQNIRTMVVGIPNVGKSTFINRISKSRSASVENKPGHTKSQQWIRINGIDLLDTPGVLPPNYEDKECATKLALVGSIKEDILPTSFLADYLLNFLKVNYPFSLVKYDIEDISKKENEQILLEIATRRKLIQDGLINKEKAESLLLNDFKNGQLGGITLEMPKEVA